MDELYLYSLIQDVKQHKVLASADLSALEQGVKFDAHSYGAILEEAKSLATSEIQSNDTFLESIFPNLKSRKPTEKMWYSHSPLSLDVDFFPTQQPEENANLVHSFSEEIKMLSGSSTLSKAETFYTYCKSTVRGCLLSTAQMCLLRLCQSEGWYCVLFISG